MCLIHRQATARCTVHRYSTSSARSDTTERYSTSRIPQEMARTAARDFGSRSPHGRSASRESDGGMHC